MQLILSIDDIGLKNNMSSAQERNDNEKEIKNPLLDKILRYSVLSVTNESTEKDNQIVQDNQNSNGTVTDDEVPSSDVLDRSEKNSKNGLNETSNIESDVIQTEYDEGENISKEIKTESKNNDDYDKSEEDSAEKQSEVNCDKNDDSVLAKSNLHNTDKNNVNEEVMCTKDEDNSHVQEGNLKYEDNVEEELRMIHENQLEDFETDDFEDNGKDSEENSPKRLISEEIINIADEKDSSNTKLKNKVAMNTPLDVDECTENNKEEILLNKIDDTDIMDESTEKTKEEICNKVIENHEKSNVITELDDTAISDESTESTQEKISTTVIKNQDESNLITELDDTDISDESTENTRGRISIKKVNDHEKSNFVAERNETAESMDVDKGHNSFKEVQENAQSGEDKNNSKVNADHIDKTDPTNKVMNFKLSNMLDILSDDEDNNTSKPESPKQEPESESSNKQCINIEDDDDIMLIDDESINKENKIAENNLEKTDDDSKDVKDLVDHVDSKQDVKEEKNVQNEPGSEDSKTTQEATKKPEPKMKALEKTPLLSTTTLKSFKKNLAEMTREELEDFCILKIVESVFDKSNLGEIKSQIKVLAQNIEDYKAKAKMLTKQNRDLQLVLKSVQEEQKKNSSAIAPLKITRSVGMQVLMTDKNSRKRQGQPFLPSQTPINPNINSQSTSNHKSQNKSQVNSNSRNTKPQQPIPVPRLIPAVNVSTKSNPTSSPQAINNPGKSPTVNNIPNGVKSTPPATKPEKRSHNKMQQNSSVTVDLTDDEPPAKVNNRNFNSSVRCVPPQSLLAPQRSPLPQNINSPKKVYIPISGPQSQNIRPGQTIMLKSVPTSGPRPRGPPNNVKIAPNPSGAIRNSRTLQRHPAPLPDFMKQYQPPNWKGLPPAPELKLAKVENGIVISWKIDGYREENHEEIASYQLFAYQETSAPPSTSLWKKIGDVKALPLPMACTLTQFMSGYKYYFAVRAVDVRSRFGPFSLPGSILLLKNQ